MEVPADWDLVQLTAAKLFSQGKSRHHVARKLKDYLLSAHQLRNGGTAKQHMLAMRKLRRWQETKAFRDLVWQYTVERLDSRTPEIMDGVTARAANGRVDAAKLALEVAGRYSPKGHDQPTAVQIVVNGVPRPTAVTESADVVDGELVSESEEL
jgi:hypothetical protein